MDPMTMMTLAMAGGGLASSLAGQKVGGDTTTTTQGTSGIAIPDWQKNLLLPLFQSGQGLFNQQTGGPGMGLMQPAAEQYGKTMAGGYLSPESNPFLQQYGDVLSRGIRANVDSAFSGAGRYGSGAHQGVLAQQTGDALSKLYGGAYDAERGRMFSAMQGAPAFEAAAADAPWNPYKNLFGMLGGSFGGTTATNSTVTQPYFTSALGDKLGGLLGATGLGTAAGIFPKTVVGGLSGAVKKLF